MMLEFITADLENKESKWCFDSMRDFAEFYHAEDYKGPNTDDYVREVVFCGKLLDMREEEIELFYDVARRFYWGCAELTFNKVEKGKPTFSIKPLENGWSIIDNRTNLRAVSRDSRCVQNFLQWASRYIQPLRKTEITGKWLKWIEGMNEK